jgi:hypothetical protein
VTQQKNPPRDDLTHYGVKGMHWGVRKGRTGRLNVRAARDERVASGTGSLRDKAVTLAGTTTYGLVKSRGGLKKDAARRAANKRAQIERLSTGKSKVTDLLRAYGTTSYLKIARSTHTKSDFVPKKG